MVNPAAQPGPWPRIIAVARRNQYYSQIKSIQKVFNALPCPRQRCDQDDGRYFAVILSAAQNLPQAFPLRGRCPRRGRMRCLRSAWFVYCDRRTMTVGDTSSVSPLRVEPASPQGEAFWKRFALKLTILPCGEGGQPLTAARMRCPRWLRSSIPIENKPVMRHSPVTYGGGLPIYAESCISHIPLLCKMMALAEKRLIDPTNLRS